MIIIGEACANTRWAAGGYVSSVICCETTLQRICEWVNMWQSATSCPFLSHPLLSDRDWSSSPPCYLKLHPGVCAGSVIRYYPLTHSGLCSWCSSHGKMSSNQNIYSNIRKMSSCDMMWSFRLMWSCATDKEPYQPTVLCNESIYYKLQVKTTETISVKHSAVLNVYCSLMSALSGRCGSASK